MPQAVTHRSSRPAKRARYSHATHRLREIERIIADRHDGIVPDTDDADMYILPAALCFRQLAIDRGREPTPEHIAEQVTFWCERWAFSYVANVPSLVERVCRSKVKGIGKADQIAKDLMLSDADRSRLDIRTIGACDLTKKARAARSKEKRRERDRIRAAAKRAAAGAVSRAEYLAKHDLARTQPWISLGINRATYFRRRAKGLLAVQPVGEAAPAINPAQ